MLNGPPGAGKSTYIASHANPGDKCVDIDLISRELPLKERLQIRREQLVQASLLQSDATCWFCTAAPTRGQRLYWRSVVKIDKTLLFVPPLLTCVERAHKREGDYRMSPNIEQWFRLYEPPSPDEPNTLLITA